MRQLEFSPWRPSEEAGRGLRRDDEGEKKQEEGGWGALGSSQLQVKVALPAAHCPPAPAAAQLPTPKSGVTTPSPSLETLWEQATNMSHYFW